MSLGDDIANTQCQFVLTLQFGRNNIFFVGGSFLSGKDARSCSLEIFLLPEWKGPGVLMFFLYPPVPCRRETYEFGNYSPWFAL